MRVQIVDPPAYTPPYDHALCAALTRAGAEVELITSRFPYGPVPRESGYTVDERFYGLAARVGSARARRLLRAVEHGPEMLAYGRAARDADVVHYQWLPLPGLDRRLLPSKRPRVFTMHYRLPPPESRLGRKLARLLGEMDAVVVHSEHGECRLQAAFGVPAERLHTIPHGAFGYLTRQPDERPLPPELAAVEGPVILAFGLIRPYKGTDVLLRAFRELEGAELWIVGMPRMPLGELYRLAAEAPGTVRFVDRFVPDPEIPAFMRRADLVALPYRNIEQSGVLYTALAFGRPMVLSAVGGFPEIAAQGAARLVPPEDPAALAEVLRELLADPAARERMAAAAGAVAAGPSSWEEIGRSTLEMYEGLLRR
ncbi:MAG: glycosyltransferase family 1 protein [Solirubrobacterales bacterium]|nr:glycosyltransferase family 1 protein [Solirubrobacterales bacterium]